MKCPYLVDESKKKACRRMIEEGKDGELSRFDLEQYCNRKPINCYFFRSAQSRALGKLGLNRFQANRRFI